MLSDLVGKDKGNDIFDANFPESLDGYMPGEILTFAQLKDKTEGTIIHILYKDEDGDVSADGFYPLYKDKECKEWSAGGSFPFPVDDLSDDDLIKTIDNCGYDFTISEALPAKKGDFAKLREGQQQYRDVLTEMLDLQRKLLGTTDKKRKIEIKKDMRTLEKKINKLWN